MTNVYAAVVYENDKFDISFGSNRRMNHEPLLGGKRGKWLGAVGYVAFERDGIKGEDFVWVEADYIERVKKQARGSSGASSPWTQWPEAMWAKTALKQLCKTADLSPDVRETVARAAELEGAIDVPASVETSEPATSELTAADAPTPPPARKKAAKKKVAAPPPPSDDDVPMGNDEQQEPADDGPELFQ